jgi:hypothetical protein
MSGSVRNSDPGDFVGVSEGVLCLRQRKWISFKSLKQKWIP